MTDRIEDLMKGIELGRRMAALTRSADALREAAEKLFDLPDADAFTLGIALAYCRRAAEIEGRSSIPVGPCSSQSDPGGPVMHEERIEALARTLEACLHAVRHLPENGMNDHRLDLAATLAVELAWTVLPSGSVEKGTGMYGAWAALGERILPNGEPDVGTLRTLAGEGIFPISIDTTRRGFPRW